MPRVLSRIEFLPVILMVGLFATSSSAQPAIFDANFDAEPLGPIGTQSTAAPHPLRLPTETILDSPSDRVDVSNPVGDFTSKVMLIEAGATDLASAAFQNFSPPPGQYNTVRPELCSDAAQSFWG